MHQLFLERRNYCIL